jgi:hypothetical protein
VLVVGLIIVMMGVLSDVWCLWWTDLWAMQRFSLFQRRPDWSRGFHRTRVVLLLDGWMPVFTEMTWIIHVPEWPHWSGT